MKVYRTRRKKYHTDRWCRGLDKSDAKDRIRELDRETAEAWDLEPCKLCVETIEASGHHTKWDEFVADCRNP